MKEKIGDLINDNGNLECRDPVQVYLAILKSKYSRNINKQTNKMNFDFSSNFAFQ